MSNQELNNYIYAQSQRGMNADEIRKILVQNGWGKEDIDSAFAIVKPKEAPAPAPAVTPTQPEIQQQKSAVFAAALPVQEPVVDMFDMDAAAAEPVQAKSQPMMQPQAQPAVQPLTQPMAQPAGMPGATVFDDTQPAAQPTQQPTTMASQSGVVMKDGMSGKTKMLVFGGIALVLLGLIAGGAFAYYKFYTSPSRVGGLMLQNLQQLKSFDYSIDIRPSLVEASALQSAIGSNVTAVQVTGTGSVNVPFDAQASGSLQAALALTKTDSSVESLGFEIRLVEGAFFASITNPKEWPLPGAAELITGKWITFDPDAVAAAGEAGTDLTAEEKGQMRTAFVNNKVVTFEELKGTETIHDAPTTHYAFTVNKDGLNAFVQAVTPILVAHNICAQTECDALKTKVSEMQNMSGDVWIGKKDYQLYQVRMLLNNPEENAELTDVVVLMTLWNHNGGSTVEVPSPTVDLGQIMSGLLGSPLGGLNINTNVNTNDNSNVNGVTNTNAGTNTNAATNTNSAVNSNAPINTNTANTNSTANQNVNTAVDPAVDSDGDGLTDVQETTLYGSNPHDSDTDNDGYTDGDEVDHGYNPTGPGTLEK